MLGDITKSNKCWYSRTKKTTSGQYIIINTTNINNSDTISFNHEKNESNTPIGIIKKIKKNVISSKFIKNSNLFERQNFYIDDSAIRVIKFSYDNKYLVTGSKKGIIKIFEILKFQIMI